uniref:Complement C3-like n=1 Tax=Dermatophagoides pteronyssinus TaxID=6956 RepID=A0A6P6YL90_DERPT|nr:complement C3-like [Dermatophagoides pteronyssinus]
MNFSIIFSTTIIIIIAINYLVILIANIADCQSILAPRQFYLGTKSNEIFCFPSDKCLNASISFSFQKKFLKKFFENEFRFLQTNDNHTISRAEIELPEQELLLKNYQQQSHDDNKVLRKIYMKIEFPSENHYVLSGDFPLINDSIIYFQTNKPIYRSNELVRFRVLETNRGLMVKNDQCNLTIKNQQKIKLDFTQLSLIPPYYFTEYEFQLPKITKEGIWEAELSCKNGMDRLNFEVKNYQLPIIRIDVLTPSIHYCSSKRFQIQINATYTYGKPVKGFLYFEIIMIKPPYQQMKKFHSKNLCLKNGSINYSIDNSIFPCKNRYDLPKTFYIRTTVMDKSTNTKQQANSENFILTSRPYILSNSHTIPYYRKNFTNFVVIQVKNFKHQPVPNVPLNIKINSQNGFEIKTTPISNDNVGETESLKTDKNGIVIVTFRLKELIGRLKVIVTTNDTRFAKAEQAFIDFSLQPFDRNENVGIFIVNKKQLFYHAGDQYQSKIDYDLEQIEPKSLYWLATSKGYVFHREPLSFESKQIVLNISNQMAPSVRILVFGLNRNTQELISDSILIHVEQKDCGVKIELENLDSKNQNDEDSNVFKPGSMIRFRFYGQQNDIVAMNAVDESIYILRNKSFRAKFQQQMQTYDIGNGPGGGKSSQHILDGAGFKLLQPINLNHKKSSLRNKRSIRRRNNNNNNNNKHQPCLLHQHLCCRMALSLSSPKSCQELSEIIRKYSLNHPQCYEYFLECCNCKSEDGLQTSSVNRPGISKSKPNYEFNHPSSSSSSEPSEQEIDQQNTRYDFRDSWLFDLILLNGSSDTHEKPAPHSITSWIISSMSISAADGLCFLEDKRITIYKPFFIHVSMPEYLILNEHTEIRATIFNYLDENLIFRIFLYKNDEICSEASKKLERFEINLNIDARSSSAKVFPIVPIKVGTFTIRLKAMTYVNGKYMSDIIEKNITILYPGKIVEEITALDLDPGNRARRETTTIVQEKPTNQITSKVYPEKHLQKIDILFQKNIYQQRQQQQQSASNNEIVPGTMSHKLSLIGSKFNPSIKSIEELDYLIKKPKGCGEQNMYYMAFNLYTMKYLKQIGKLQERLEIRAKIYLKRALKQQLNFRKEDGSFSAFVERESSVWLTAFVTKVFCQSGTLLRDYMDNDVIVQALRWLLQKQLSDGSWAETFPILHEKALGGVNQGSHTLTAYIVIALNECQKYLIENDVSDANDFIKQLDKNITLAQKYLQRKIRFVHNNSYSLSIITYSFILRSSTSTNIDENSLIMNLMNHPDKQQDTISNYYYYNNDYPIETTSYVLLSLAKYLPKNSMTDSLANYLTLQQKDGTFDNTQNTIVALEALTNYYSTIVDLNNQKFQLKSNISFNYRPKRSIEFTESNHDLLHIIDVDNNINNVDIVTLGNGLGKIELLTTYNVLNPEDNKCQFELSIVLSEWQDNYNDNDGDYYDYDDYKLIFNNDTNKLMEEMSIESFNSNNNDDYDICEYADNDSNSNNGIKKRSVWTQMMNRLRPKNNTTTTKKQQNQINKMKKEKKSSNTCPSDSFDTVPNLGIENPVIRLIKIRYRRLNDDEMGMIILEVGLLSGYKVIASDLEQLKSNGKILESNVVVSKIEFYLKDVPYAKHDCLSFRIYQENVVTESQSALINIYDYYRPGSMCSRLYNDTHNESKIHNCNEICQCQTEKICPSKLDSGLKDLTDKNIDNAFNEFKRIICKEFSFIIEGKIIRKEFKFEQKKYLITLEILNIFHTDILQSRTEKLKIDGNIVGKIWQFYLEQICDLYHINDQTLIFIRKSNNDGNDDDNNFHNGIRLIDGQTIIYEKIQKI